MLYLEYQTLTKYFLNKYMGRERSKGSKGGRGPERSEGKEGRTERQRRENEKPTSPMESAVLCSHFSVTLLN